MVEQQISDFSDKLATLREEKMHGFDEIMKEPKNDSVQGKLEQKLARLRRVLV